MKLIELFILFIYNNYNILINIFDKKFYINKIKK